MANTPKPTRSAPNPPTPPWWGQITVRDLKSILSDEPDDKPVWIHNEYNEVSAIKAVECAPDGIYLHEV